MSGSIRDIEVLPQGLNQMLDVIEQVDGSSLALPAREARYLDFEPREFARRYARLVALMEEVGLDALVVAQSTSVRYFTGLQSWIWILPPVMPTVAILPRDPARATLIDTAMETGGVEQTTWIREPTLYGSTANPIDVITEALSQRGLAKGRIGFELGTAQRPNLSPMALDRLLHSLGDATIVDAGPLLTALRTLKSPAEVALLREATRLAQVGFLAAFDSIRPGVTELELIRIAAAAIIQAGGHPGYEPMTIICLAGPERYQQIIQPAVDYPVSSGVQVWMDGGCTYRGYRADFMRSAVIGRLPDEAERFFGVAVEALEMALTKLEPGRPLRDPCEAVSAVFKRRGIPGVDLPYELGHSIGMDHWELPMVASTGDYADVIARPGMVLCIEPTILGPDGDAQWRSGLFAIEDQVHVTEDGVEVLTADLPRDLYRVKQAR